MSKQTKALHTPGPWTTYGHPADGITIRARGCAVADVIPQRGADEANARLIAAAPDLLEALEDAARWIDTLPDDLRLGSIMPDKLRAALAKATGES